MQFPLPYCNLFSDYCLYSLLGNDLILRNKVNACRSVVFNTDCTVGSSWESYKILITDFHCRQLSKKKKKKKTLELILMCSYDRELLLESEKQRRETLSNSEIMNNDKHQAKRMIKIILKYFKYMAYTENKWNNLLLRNLVISFVLNGNFCQEMC